MPKIVSYLRVRKSIPSITFEFLYSKSSITFLDTKIYNNQDGILCTTICRKPNNLHNFLHYDSAHPKSLKDSIPFSQALHIKQISSETFEVTIHFKDLKDALIKRAYDLQLLDYHFELLDYHFERVMCVDRKPFLQTKEKPATKEHLSLVVTFNESVPNIKNVIDKH